MSVVLGFILGALFLLVILIVYVLKVFSHEEEVVYKSKKNVLSINNLDLPPQIEAMTEFLIASIIRKIYSVYIKFDYKNATEEQLYEKQWHSWQVSMLLKLYKYNQEFYIGNKEEIFPKSILDLKLKSLESLVYDILKKYRDDVEVTSSKDLLCKDIRWSVRDVTILFCYLSKYREL